MTLCSGVFRFSVEKVKVWRFCSRFKNEWSVLHYGLHCNMSFANHHPPSLTHLVTCESPIRIVTDTFPAVCPCDVSQVAV